MIKKIKNFFVNQSTNIICGLVENAAPLISQDCEIFWYQEKEPEGMKEFLKKHQRSENLEFER